VSGSACSASAVGREASASEPFSFRTLYRQRQTTPNFEGARLTLRRRVNFQVARFQRLRRHVRVAALPYVLTVDPLNGCNLHCPHCMTGAGKHGHDVTTLPRALYARLLDELAPTLLLVEFGNWGEPLLDRRLPDLIEAASARGLGTIVATHLSVPLDDAQARALVASGLNVLGVALDGARQETYEQYRVGGRLELVVENIARITRAKRRLHSTTPRIVWSYHVFAHNEHEIEEARARAAALGVDFAFSKGFVTGPDWDPEGRFPFIFEARDGEQVEPCSFLWERAVVSADGGVAPCLGAFSPEDDCGRLDGHTFREVWNGARFKEARRFYRAAPESLGSPEPLCAGCPQTVLFGDYRAHLAGGGTTASFAPGLTAHDGWNYFFHRARPRRLRDEPVSAGARRVPVSAPSPAAASLARRMVS